MINIAKQIYAGWSSTTGKYDLPEAEVIPIGTSLNEKKKLEKFMKVNTFLTQYENIPIPGFTLYKTNRKNYGSSDQTWLIIDPRGFLVRITNDNLEKILEVTGITEGLIQQKCVWAREDSRTAMYLLPSTSEIFSEAVENTDLIENKVTIKDVQIGDKVILQSGLTGRYMGTQSLYAPVAEYAHNGQHRPQVYLRRQIVEVETRKFHCQADVKILKVSEKTSTPLTRDESIDYMNKCISDHNDTLFTASTDMSSTKHYYPRMAIRHISSAAVSRPTMSFVEVTRTEADELFVEAQVINDVGVLIIQDRYGSAYILNISYSLRGAGIVATAFQVTQLFEFDPTATPGSLVIVQDKTRSETGYSYNIVKSKLYTLDNFVKFYKIVKHVKTESYI